MKWKSNMTQVQRAKYNSYQRRRALKKKLEDGLVPIPRKPDPKLLELYQSYGLEYAVELPLGNVNRFDWAKIKEEERRIRFKAREIVRDSLPAGASKEEFKAAWLEAQKTIFRELVKKYET